MEPWGPVKDLQFHAFDKNTEYIKEGELQPDEAQEYGSVLIGHDLGDAYGRSYIEVITGEGRHADEELARLVVDGLHRVYGVGECPRCGGGPLYMDRADADRDVAHCDDCGEEISGDEYRVITRLKSRSILAEIGAERLRQDQEWGAQHDDHHGTTGMLNLILSYAGKARTSDVSVARRRLIQVAALAAAAVESIDRKNA